MKTIWALISLACLIGGALGFSKCGNVGEDYWDLKQYYIQGVGAASYPTYLFRTNIDADNNTICNFTRTDCSGNPGGYCNKFVDGTVTYQYVCTVLEPEEASALVNNITGFSPSYYEDAGCICELPATPAGKYINGYTLRIEGKHEWSTVDLESCHVDAVSYQNTPLAYGDVFTQKLVLVTPKSHLVAIIVGVTVGIVVFLVVCMIQGMNVWRKRFSLSSSITLELLGYACSIFRSLLSKSKTTFIVCGE